MIPQPASHCRQTLAYQSSYAVTVSSASRTRLCSTNSRSGVWGNCTWQPVNATAPPAAATCSDRRRVTLPCFITERHSSLITRHLEVARRAIGRCLHLLVAVDAVGHVQRAHLSDLAHLGHVAVAGGAGEARLEVRLVRKAHV